MEFWKDIKGYEGIYEVSSLGRIRSSKDKVTKSVLHGERKWQQRVIKQKIDKINSCRVTLWKNKISKDFLVHRLVAEAFLKGIDGKEYVNHKDGNRLNNDVENLEWCDHKENNNHAFDGGLMPTNRFIILEDLITGELIKFRSGVKASEFLGRNQSYVSHKIRNNEYIIDHYCVYVTLMDNKTRVGYLGKANG